MKKKEMKTAIAVILLILFNVAFFLLGGSDHPTSVWISYGFIHLAWLFYVAAPFLPIDRSIPVLGLTVYSALALYCFLVFAIGIVFILVSPPSAKVALLVQLILLGLFVASLLILLMGNDRTEQSVSKAKMHKADVEDMSQRAKKLLDLLDDENANRELERLFHLIDAFPVNDAAKLYSSEFQSTFDELEQAVNNRDADLCGTLGRQLQRLLQT